jgi:hypothetical protein
MDNIKNVAIKMKWYDHEWVGNVLLATTFGSWGGFEILKSVSEFCKLILPITGVLSFLIYLYFSWKKYKKNQNESK